jgi:hypothetical protein
MKVIFRIVAVIFISVLMAGCMPKTEHQVLNQAGTDFQNKNYRQAFDKLMPLAKNNNAQAQYSVGYMYYYGLGVMEDTKQAKYWIEKSAKNGNSNAIRALEIEKFPHARI